MFGVCEESEQKQLSRELELKLWWTRQVRLFVSHTHTFSSELASRFSRQAKSFCHQTHTNTNTLDLYTHTLFLFFHNSCFCETTNYDHRSDSVSTWCDWNVKFRPCLFLLPVNCWRLTNCLLFIFPLFLMHLFLRVLWCWRRCDL